MTGFGRGEAALEGRSLSVELKSVNHRFLDLSFRMPPALSHLEGSLRAALTKALHRGHVDISVRYENSGQQAAQVALDLPLARAYADAWQQLKDTLALPGRPGLSDVAMAPGVLSAKEAQEDEGVLSALLQRAAAQALEQLTALRRQEGQALKGQLEGCLASLLRLREDMAAAAKDQPRLCRERLVERLEQLTLDGMDPQRLAQEAALQADRCAVDEELARLAAHLEQLAQLLAAQGPVGRKLDFLAQEIHRELNTIGSKSVSIELTQLMLEGKNQLEKLREQAQNIE